MKFKVGDRVKFLNDTGGGVVSGIVDERTVKVMTEDGFEIPVQARELIKPLTAGNYDNRRMFVEKKAAPDNSNEKNIDMNCESGLPENVSKNAAKNALLGFVTKNKDNTGTSDIDIYLINDSAYALFYFAGYQENVTWHFLKTGYLEPDTKLYLNTFNQSEVSKIKNIHIQLMFLGKGKYHPQPMVEKFIGLDNVRFYKENTFKENEYFHKKALILEVTENLSDKLEQSFGDELANAMMAKKKDLHPMEKSASKPHEIEEIDLHIEEIAEDYVSLSPGEILNIQMNKFYTSVEGGIINKVQKIVFIHGIGNGKLKYELGKALDEKYPDLKYQDASFKEYGYGATLVYLT